MAVAYLAALLVEFITSYRQASAFNTIALEVIQKLREQVFSHALSLPIAYFDRNATGALISRLTNDTEAIKNLYVDVISFFAQNIVRMTGILIAMAVLDIRLMWICALLIPVAIFLMAVYRRVSTPIFQQARSLLSDINRKINESVSGMWVIQLMNQQRRFQENFQKISADYAQVRIKETGIINGFLLRPLIECIQLLLLAALLFGFGLSELSGAGVVQVGVIYAFVSYLGNFVEPLTEMTSRLNAAQRALVAAGRVFELLDEDTGGQAEPLGVPENCRLSIDIQRFSYDGKKDALRDIRFDIEEGEFIGIVGHTGSGKSTLMSLLMDFYPIGQGDIRMGGIPIPQIHKATYTRLIGFVQQEPFIFAGTVADNIRLGLPLDWTAVIEAAKQAQLHDMVMGLPDGYDTELTGQGGNLSTGQRHLLSVTARVISGVASHIQVEETEALHVSRIALMVR
ncbi:MAG: ATP-binding cassette, subfamily B/ATP-binding cassette, subfamily B, multidrug efflux pump, partial [Candidatus Kentron sp. G]